MTGATLTRRRVRVAREPGPERVVIYARISDDPRKKEEGVGRQREDGKALAASRGWAVVGVFTDNDVKVLRAGSPRPDYDAMMALVRRGQVDRIIAYGLARLVRNRRERAELIEELGKHRVSISLVRGGEIDTSSAAGRAVAGLLGETDTMESEIKGERVARAALERAEKGKAAGHVMYGWRRVYDRAENGAVKDWHDVECETTGPIVRRIVAELLARRSLRDVARGLNADGILPPRKWLRHINGNTDAAPLKVADYWQTSTVSKIATRPANIARRMREREDFGPAAYPALVDEADHAAVVAMLTDPTRRKSNDGDRVHLLTYGIGVCGECLGPFSVHRIKGRKATHRDQVLYQCADSGHVSRNRDRVDELVTEVVTGRLAQPDALDLLTRDDRAAREARERAAAARARLSEVQDDYDHDRITRDMYLRSSTRWKAALGEAESDVLANVQGVDPSLVNLASGPNARAVWDDVLTLAQRRALMIALGVEVTINKTARRGPGFDASTIVVTFGAALDNLGFRIDRTRNATRP